ncbi:MAG: class D sortase [Acidobacteriota bacterium]|nr:class D sortase [Acidobacteriota bacterium]
MRSKILRLLEIATLTAGIGLTAFYVTARVAGYLGSRAAIEQIETATAKPPAAPWQQPKSSPGHAALAVPSTAKADLSLWSPGRLRAYSESLAREFPPPIAVLKIPKIHLAVPVFEGTGELILNRGVGRIAGTAAPGSPGNVGIAGHRDGFFRGLRNVSRGDVIVLERREGTLRYIIDKIEIVSPKDVSVLAPRGAPALTLVTCYPFYYIGSAPKRYVVEASLDNEARKHNQRSDLLNSGAVQGEVRK